MTVIGRVEYIADIDGKKLPAAARKIGRAAGGEMGKAASNAYSSEFDDALTKYARKFTSGMRSNGTLSGQSFSDAMRSIINSEMNDLVGDMAEVFGKKGGIEAFAERMGGAGAATDKLRANLERLNAENRVTSSQYKMLVGQIDSYSAGVMEMRRATSEASAEQSKMDLVAARLGNTLDDLAKNKMQEMRKATSDAALEQSKFNLESIKMSKTLDYLAYEKWANNTLATKEATAANERVRASSDKVTRSLMEQGDGWRGMSHGMRQAIFYTTLFAAMGDELAILGSAAGSSLTVLAGAAGALGVGLGVGIAAFKNLGDELTELPEAVWPAAEAFRALGNTFDVLQDQIQAAAAPGITEGFTVLKTVVDALTPALAAVGATVGELFAQFARGLAPGTQGFENLLALITAASPVLQSLANAALSFGQAFGNIFVAAIPFVQIFSDWLARIAGEFLMWTNSISGQNALEEWFQNGLTIMQAIEPLIAAVAKALADLITPDAIADFVDFLGLMTEFMPLLSDILAVVGELNVFNILAEILVAIGQALQPVLPALGEMAAILSTSLIYAIQSLVPPLANLMEGIAPLLPVLAELVSAILTVALTAIIPLVDAISAELLPLLPPLLESILPLIPSFVQLAEVVGIAFVQAVVALMPLIGPLIDLVINLFQALEPMMPMIVILIEAAFIPLTTILPIATTLIGALIDIVAASIRWFTDMANKILEPIGGIKGLNDAVQGSIGAFEDWGNSVGGVIDDVLGSINDAIDGFLKLFGVSSKASSIKTGGGSDPAGRYAAGGIAAYGARRMTGEAGREAIVPLQRPLAAVDPSVRTLAAFAQGKLGQMSASGGGKTVTFAEGAIIVQTVSPDGRLVAEAVVDRIAADADI